MKIMRKKENFISDQSQLYRFNFMENNQGSDSQNKKKKNHGHRGQKKRPVNDDDDEGYNSEDEYVLFDKSKSTDYNSSQLEGCLDKIGYVICRMAKDGNCLFRSVADQIYGDPELHGTVRNLCMDYMERERDHYSQFVTEDFPDYIGRKRKDRVFGNHLELQAICELYNRPVEIYVTDENPINLFHEIYKTDNPPIRLSYHSGNHYNSVRDPKNPTVGVGLGIPNFKKGSVDNALVDQALVESENNFYEEKMMEESIKDSEQTLIEEELKQSAIEDSLKQNEHMILEDSLLDQMMYESDLDLTYDLIEQAILLESMQNSNQY